MSTRPDWLVVKMTLGEHPLKIILVFSAIVAFLSMLGTGLVGVSLFKAGPPAFGASVMAFVMISFFVEIFMVLVELTKLEKNKDNIKKVQFPPIWRFWVWLFVLCSVSIWNYVSGVIPIYFGLAPVTLLITLRTAMWANANLGEGEAEEESGTPTSVCSDTT